MSIYAVRSLAGEVKARSDGTAQVFEWDAPEPPLFAAPTLTVYLPSGTVGPTPFGGSTPSQATIVSLSDGRRLLTIDAPPSDGWGGRQGAAWIVTDSVATPVRVLEVSRTGGATETARLADPLARDLPTSDPGVLIWAHYEIALPVVAVPTRNIRMEVRYSPGYGDETSPLNKVERHVLHYVPQPFATGLAARDLRDYLRTLPGSASAGDISWEWAMEAGEAELILWLRGQLAERGLTEDDLPAPQALRLAHLMLAGSHAVQGQDGALSDRLRTRATELADAAMRHMWVDSDRDGVLDAGEVADLGGPRSTDFRAYSPPTTRTRLFSIGMSH